MKTHIFSILFGIIILSATAQNNVGINNPAPDPSAALDVKSDTMGLLPPRVADTTMIANPAEGLMIYDLSSHCMRYFNGTVWSGCMGFYNPQSSWNCGDLLFDSRDNLSYETVQIGTQCWMAENLNIGIMIPGNQTPTDNSYIEKFCQDYGLGPCESFGGLYSWDEMMQYNNASPHGICPEGWHVPSRDEWCIMENYVDAGTIICDGTTGLKGTDAGGNLKDTGTAEWNAPNTGATNSSGFTARPGGYFYPGTGFGGIGGSANFWTSTEGAAFATTRGMSSGSAKINHGSNDKSAGLAVRCIKD